MNLLKLKKKIGERLSVFGVFVVLNNLAFLKILIKFVHDILLSFFKIRIHVYMTIIKFY